MRQEPVNPAHLHHWRKPHQPVGAADERRRLRRYDHARSARGPGVILGRRGDEQASPPAAGPAPQDSCIGSGTDPQGSRRRRTGGGCPQRRRLHGRISVGSINVGATEGRRAAPGQCRMFAAKLRGHRRGRPARPARSRGRRLCRRRGGRCAVRRPAGSGAPHRAGQSPRRGPAGRGHRRGVPRPWRAVGERRRSHSATSTVWWAPMRSTRPRASGWLARAASVSSRSGPRWRSGCDRGCRRRTGICR